MKKYLCTGLTGIVAAALVLAPQFAVADGMVIRPDPFRDQWDFAAESDQQAFITYADGVETLAIAITAEQLTNDAVWIFPVPADPAKVVVEILDAFPTIDGGEEVGRAAAARISEQRTLLLGTQVYPIPLLSIFRPVAYTTKLLEFSNTLGGAPRAVEQDVTVVEHLEKDGVTAELVTAKSGQALAAYLQEKGLTLQPGAIPALKYYDGKDYAFVVSWITAPQTVKNRQSIIETIAQVYFHLDRSDPTVDWSKLERLTEDDLRALVAELAPLQNGDPARLREIAESMRIGAPALFGARGGTIVRPEDLTRRVALSVSFPTDRIFFPLQPTGVYGSAIVPLTLRVLGFVQPDMFRDIVPYMTVTYHTSGYQRAIGVVPPGMEYVNKPYQPIPWGSSAPRGGDYTKVVLQSPSKLLTDDLWIDSGAPLQATLARFNAAHPIIAAVILLILLSVLSGALAGLGVFREWRSWRGARKFALIGFWNSFSLFGMLIALGFARTKLVREEDRVLVEQLQAKGYDTHSLQRSDLRKLWFALLFSGLFIVFSLSVTEIVKLIVR